AGNGTPKSQAQTDGSANGAGNHGAGNGSLASANRPQRRLAFGSGPQPVSTNANGHANGTSPRARLSAEVPPARGSQRLASGLSPQPGPIGGASGSAEPEPPIRTEPMSGLVGAGSARSASGQRSPQLAVSSGPAPTRAAVDAGEPYPPISGRPQDLGT